MPKLSRRKKIIKISAKVNKIASKNDIKGQ